MSETRPERNSAFIICNGVTRAELKYNKHFNEGRGSHDHELDVLNEHTTFGCNALYREWQPSYLISIDPGITEEIQTSGYNGVHIVPPLEEQYENPDYHIAHSHGPHIEKVGSTPRSNAGMNAMLEAIKLGYNFLYIMGMDCIVNNVEYAMSNMYDKTDNYGMDTRASLQDQKARCAYLNWVSYQHPTVHFRFVLPQHAKKDPERVGAEAGPNGRTRSKAMPMSIYSFNGPNVSGMYYDHFIAQLESGLV
jgi:hypothetical protein